jgi:hypothetical protein
MRLEEVITMGYLDNAKEKAEIAKKMSEQREKVDPEWKRLVEELTKPAPPEQQKLLDKLGKELVEELKKGQGHP